MGSLLGRSRALSAACLSVALLALIALTFSATGCSPAPEPQPKAPSGFDVNSLRWHPEKLAAARPSLVAWRYANDAHGVLVALDAGAENAVLWEAPSTQTLIQLEDVAPDGTQMVARVTPDLNDLSTVRHVVYRPDGSVDELPMPEGFEDFQDVGFMGQDVLLLAYHATREEFASKLGVVGTDGRWRDFEIVGDLPEYWFLDSFVTLPGKDVVGLVLKTQGGSDNRDDDVLVLAKRQGTRLEVFTTPYGEDSLPGCEPLRTGQGVAFGRVWNDNMSSDATVYVRAEWTGTAWAESVIAPTTFSSIIERGDVLAEGPAGDFWLRSAANAGHGTESTLLRLSAGSSAPVDTGIDATDIAWFCWIEMIE